MTYEIILTWFNIHNISNIVFSSPKLYKFLNSACSDSVHFPHTIEYNFPLLSLRCWNLLIWSLCFISYLLSLNSLRFPQYMSVPKWYHSCIPKVLSWVIGLYPLCMSSWCYALTYVGKTWTSIYCYQFWIQLLLQLLVFTLLICSPCCFYF